MVKENKTAAVETVSALTSRVVYLIDYQNVSVVSKTIVDRGWNCDFVRF